MQIKLNYTSTTWWLTLGSFVISGLVLLGIISEDRKEESTFAATQVIQGLSVLAVQGGVVYHYFQQKKKKVMPKRRTKFEKHKNDELNEYLTNLEKQGKQNDCNNDRQF